MTDFRDLCTELLLFAEQAGEICHNEGLWPNCDQQQVCVDGKPLWLLDRVRAALAEPKSEWPTDEELFAVAEAYAEDNGLIGLHNAPNFARAVLNRYGNPTP